MRSGLLIRMIVASVQTKARSILLPTCKDGCPTLICYQNELDLG